MIENTEQQSQVVNSPVQREHSKRHFLRALGLLTSLLIVGVVSYMVGFEMGGKDISADGIGNAAPIGQSVLINTDNPQVQVDFSLFWKVWELVKQKHIDNAMLDANKMLYGAINGMLSATGDPYTTFFSPEENQEFQEKLSGNFEGIGAEIGMKDGTLTVVAPLDDSPASKSGLLAGDRIFKVNGEDIGSLTLEQAVRKIRGPKGTKVNLTIFREGDEETRDVDVIRDVIQVRSVKVEIKDDGIALIRVSQFGETTVQEFDRAVDEAVRARSRGLVIDLRNNPGGLLDGAVSLASRLLPKGQVVVIEEEGGGKKQELRTGGGDRLSHIPTAILINEGSASASEILAGALKDNNSDGVTIIGEKSFGKGSVQQLFPVTGKTSVKITIAHWLTPSGKQINKEGISPDIEVKMTSKDYEEKRDPQLDRALEVVREKSQGSAR